MSVVLICLNTLASGAALLLAAVAFLRLKTLVPQLELQRQTEAIERAEALQLLRKELEGLAVQVHDIPPPQVVVSAQPPKSGLNLQRRSQALRLKRRGSSASQIAATLDLPLQEVELLLKVDRILMSNL